MNTATAPVEIPRCRDRFARAARLPEYAETQAWHGIECDEPVRESGWACALHLERAFAKWDGEMPVAEPRRKRGEPEPVDPEQARRQAEAIEYVKAYRGTWALILDIRADRKWGTKYLRLTDRQVEVILAAKVRDAERAQHAATEQPRLSEVRNWIDDNLPHNDFAASLYNAFERWGRLTDGQYAAVVRIIDRNAAPKGEATDKPRAEIVEGWYLADGASWKVQKAVHGSGHLYAKRLDVDAERGTAEWNFVPGGIRILAERGTPMTVEQAAEMGRLYGICMICGRPLTDEKSIAAGIGPICITRVEGGA